VLFGLAIFQDAHPGLLGALAHVSWWVLLLLHPVVLWKIWAGGNIWVFMAVLIAAQVLFFSIFGRNISTAS
jgi:hypothetical protein